MRLAWLGAALTAAAVSAGPETPVEGPRIAVAPASFDFGRVLQNKTLRKAFEVTNTGDRDLAIEGVSTTCGCTVTEEIDGPIAPGESAPLRVQFQTRSYLGRVERKVLIRSNDPRHPRTEVTLSATIVRE
jgi:Protein of unknown function (DUF1573)